MSTVVDLLTKLPYFEALDTEQPEKIARIVKLLHLMGKCFFFFIEVHPEISLKKVSKPFQLCRDPFSICQIADDAWSNGDAVKAEQILF